MKTFKEFEKQLSENLNLLDKSLRFNMREIERNINYGFIGHRKIQDHWLQESSTVHRLTLFFDATSTLGRVEDNVKYKVEVNATIKLVKTKVDLTLSILTLDESNKKVGQVIKRISDADQKEIKDFLTGVNWKYILKTLDIKKGLGKASESI
jgi:hypothetical protein